MTQAFLHSSQKELTFEISYLVAKFGRRRALFAILKTYWKGKGRPPDTVSTLNDHLRRDLGLPTLAEPIKRLGSEKT